MFSLSASLVHLVHFYALRHTRGETIEAEIIAKVWHVGSVFWSREQFALVRKWYWRRQQT